MLIRDLMKPIEVLPPDAPVAEAAKIMKENDVELVPVGSQDDLRGVVTPRDIAVAAVAEPCNVEKMPVDDIATNVLGFCGEDQDVEEAVKTMRASRQTRLLVRNSDGKIIGAVSLSDILAACPDVALPAEVSAP